MTTDRNWGRVAATVRQREAAAQTILADPAAFFDAHPEIVTAAYAHVEQKRQGPVWVTRVAARSGQTWTGGES